MKVVHLLTTNTFSGAENVACKIISMFNGDTGVEMVYCAVRGPIEQLLKDRGIPFYPLDNFSFKSVKKALNVLKPDIIHAHDFRTSFYASLLKKNATLVPHIHNNALWIKKKGIYSSIFLFAAKRSKNVIVVSNSIVNEYVYTNKIKEKMVVLPNPIDINEIREKANSYTCSDNYDLLYCGRFSPEKNPLLFVDIAEKYLESNKNAKIAMIGEGPLKDEVEKCLISRGINQVSLLGFVANPYPIIKNSKVVCMPSIFEGFGLVAVEAMSLGVPIVCSGKGGLSEIVDSSTGFICSDLDSYLSSLELLEDDTVREKYSKKCVEKAETFDNIEDYKNKLSSIYGI